MFPKTIILNIKIDQSSKNDLLSKVSDYIAEKKATKPLTVFTPNPEQLVYAHEHVWYRNLLNTADIALPDGQGIVFASQILKLKARIAGVEFMEELVKIAAENNYPVAFIGGKEGVVEKALIILRKQYPKLKGWAEDGPEIQIKNAKCQMPNESEYFQRLITKIQNNKTQLIFVGLGAPKQEWFVQQLEYYLSLRAERSNLGLKKIATSPANINNFGNGRGPRNDIYPLVLMSVGGSFDIISGKIPRAPQWVQNVGIEWLWRLIHEPWRAGRQLKLLKFMLLVLTHRK